MIALWTASLAVAQVPELLEGRYDVVEVSEDGAEGEEFVEKMRRRALALGQDCFVSRRSFTFGPPAPGNPPGSRPATIEITEQVTCKKGGLGTYLAQASIEVDATWSATDPLTVSVPGATALVAMTRVQRPKGVGIAAQWAAPEFTWTLDPSSYTLVAQKTYGKKLPRLELTDGKSVYVLEPRADGGGAR